MGGWGGGGGMGEGDLRPPSPVICKNQRLFSVLPLYTVLLFCVAIAARAPFEGVTPFDSYQACA